MINVNNIDNMIYVIHVIDAIIQSNYSTNQKIEKIILFMKLFFQFIH